MKVNPIRARFVLPLISEAADRFVVTPEEIQSTTKLRTVVHARAYAIWLAWKRFNWSYPELAIVFGLDNTTCRNACLKTEEREAARAAQPSRPRLVKATAPLPELPMRAPGETERDLLERFA